MELDRTAYLILLLLHIFWLPIFLLRRCLYFEFFLGGYTLCHNLKFIRPTPFISGKPLQFIWNSLGKKGKAQVILECSGEAKKDTEYDGTCIELVLTLLHFYSKVMTL